MNSILETAGLSTRYPRELDDDFDEDEGEPTIDPELDFNNYDDDEDENYDDRQRYGKNKLDLDDGSPSVVRKAVGLEDETF